MNKNSEVEPVEGVSKCTPQKERPEYRHERHGHAAGRAMAIFWEDEILPYLDKLEGAPNTEALLQVVHEYRTNQIEGRHDLCINNNGAPSRYRGEEDDRCSICKKADEILAAPKVVDSKEEQMGFEEWWAKYLSGREIDPFPEKAALWNAKQAAWSAWHSKEEQTG